jgi:transposase InsO family protein
MTAAEIAETLGMALSTVSLILKRTGLGRRSRLEPLEPVNRYEHQRPGELAHLDIKKLARFDRPGHRLLGRGRGRFETGAGYEYLHVCVDDYSRVAYVELLADERGATSAGFLERAANRFASRGVTIERVLTDNGSGYISGDFRDCCQRLQITHTRTRPRRPQTNGKAERFIQTLLREWAYARLYATSKERASTLPTRISHYNYRRLHGSLRHQPPATRLNNVSRN